MVSGDGLVHEIINGLMQRSDWSTAIHTPIGFDNYLNYNIYANFKF